MSDVRPTPPLAAAALHTLLSDGCLQRLFDRLCRVVADRLEVPVCLTSLVGTERQSFLGAHGLEDPWRTARRTPLSHAFCRFVVEQDARLAIRDTRVAPEYREIPSVHALGVVAYAGLPIRLEAGATLGSFCAIDHAPRNWRLSELAVLEEYASLAGELIDARLGEDGWAVPRAAGSA
jgi:GAF domain-containing protein